MKKILLAALLLMAGYGVHAQSGGLTINNRQNPCDVHVKMYAIDPSSSASCGVLCSIGSATFTVPAFALVSSSTWATVYAFESAIGWTSIPCGAIISSPSSTEFNWTDCTFQFDCPSSVLDVGCSNAGHNLSDPFIIGGTCLGAGPTWTSVPWGCRNAQWVNTCASGCFLDDITIVFW